MTSEQTSSQRIEVTRKTYHCDLLRGFFRGMLTTGTQTFGLFIAIRYFDAGYLTKSLIGSAPFMGMFLSLILVHYAAKTGLKKSVLGAIPAAIWIWSEIPIVQFTGDEHGLFPRPFLRRVPYCHSSARRQLG